MNFDIRILGTASAMPISDKNPSAQVLEVQGRLFLIDCGEGTQQQMRRLHLSFLRIAAVFLSHTHGDHLFGIFGLLSTMGMYGRTETLPIYAPESFAPVLELWKTSFGGDGCPFEAVHHIVKTDAPEEICAMDHVRVTALPLRHGIETYGYRFDEILSPRQAVAHRPRSYAYCSDTLAFSELAGWVRGVDVLYHESTYLENLKDKAVMRFHSTAADAARCAAAAGVRRLLLGHYSSRVREVELFEAEARTIFPESYSTREGDSVEIDYLAADEN